MKSFELQISYKDWLYIVIIGMFFGFLISLVFYYINEEIRYISTIVFSTVCAFFISFFSFFFITISNFYILPNTQKKYWYIISFIFSFLAGWCGFSLTYILFDGSYPIVKLLSVHWLAIGITIGLLTFLIGLILHQFISMKYKNELVHSEVLQTKLEVLESELNPHFLFNALNSISELIYQDQKKAEESVLKLSKFLRNAITKKGLIDLKSEIDMLNTYLHIENIRFDEKIVFNLKCDEKYYDMLLPKFSIQLLVENAIKHGFTGELLVIDVIVDEKKVEVINNGKITSKVVFGVGLNNLQKRLHILKIGYLKSTIEDDKMKFIIHRSNR
ncbi:MAG: histidine kinase [Arcobacter sp.]|uniref:sensor histidine kinase n=1 Tax=uncultured Arcobacter sp. TaxID=165434 RepID=UPI000CA84073|nr:histidine kinase [uncultured Arcobacter sp.]PLY08196.1 MAG: histidine kinase [Arcobacter sp.]